ncbi:MAG: hypothetical protein JRF33_11645 [Deltaproteobacteria bacterium]|nr:hypothetical protein [Deltaproteobacteria bacterium]
MKMSHVLSWVALLSIFSATAWAAGPPPRSTSEVRYLLGRVSEQYVQVCLGDQNEEWVDPHFEAGFVRLIPGAGVNLATLAGKLALLEGRVDPNRHFPHPGHKGDCPGRQARMDWIFAKRGVRLLRSLAQGVIRPESFNIAKAKSFTGLSVTRKGDRLKVRFTNTLPLALSDVELLMHYEGCYGKPGTMVQSKSFANLLTGKTVGAEFPVHLRRESGKNPRPGHDRSRHVAYSLQILSKDKVALFDLDIPLRQLLGQRPACPDRQGRK